MLSANPDGSDEKVLEILPLISGQLPPYTNWSPDGKFIAYNHILSNGSFQGVDLFDIASDKVKTLVTFTDRYIYQLAWFPDGSGLMVEYKDGNAPNAQIGFISYPSGQFHTLTKDANNYYSLTFSADGKSIGAIQSTTIRNLYILPGGGGRPGAPSPVLPADQNRVDVSWVSNSELLIADAGKLIRTPLDGSSPRTLVNDPGSTIGQPGDPMITCSAGRYIVFDWFNHSGLKARNLWRVDADGSDPQRLTFGTSDGRPACALDDNWVYFLDNSAQKIMRVPIDGGKAEIVPGTIIPNEQPPERPLVSTDGKLLAFGADFLDPNTRKQTLKMFLLNLDAGPGASARMLPFDPAIASYVGFSPDGRSIVYVKPDNTVWNYWDQALDGSKPRQITDIPKDWFWYGGVWSPDGKHFAFIGYTTPANAVILHDTGPSQ